nr:hypothetical protein [Tanacetum cinerariifolium]
QMVETLRVMGDMRREMSDMQAELLALREQSRRARQPRGDARAMIDQALLRNSTNRDGSHSLHEDNRRNVQTARPCFYADFMKCQPLNFKRTEGVVGLTRWIEKMESVFQISSCTVENQTSIVLRANQEAGNRVVEPKERQSNNKGKADDSFRNNHGHQQQTPKWQNIARGYNTRTGERKPYSGNFPRSSGNTNVVNAQRENREIPKGNGCFESGALGHFKRDCLKLNNKDRGNRNNGANPKGNGCFECGATGHFKRDSPKLKNKDGEKGNAPGWVYAVGNAEKRGNASKDPDSNVMQQTEIAELRETDRRRQAQMVETLRVMGDMRREMSDMQAEL